MPQINLTVGYEIWELHVVCSIIFLPSFLLFLLFCFCFSLSHFVAVVVFEVITWLVVPFIITIDPKSPLHLTLLLGANRQYYQTL